MRLPRWSAARRSASTLRLQTLEDRTVPTILLQQNFDTTASGSLPAGWTTMSSSTATPTPAAPPAIGVSNSFSASPSNSVFATDHSATFDNYLITPTIAITGTSPTMAFKHRYFLESDTTITYFDGVQIDVSTDGTTWSELSTVTGTIFTTGGYNHTLGGGASIAGKLAWSGDSGSAFQDVAITLPDSLIGQTVQFRWHVATDVNNADLPLTIPTDLGYYLDDVVVSSTAAVSADLSVTISNGTTGVIAGTDAKYTVVVTNPTANPAPGTKLSASVAGPPNVTAEAWTVTNASGGATAATNSGSSDITNLLLNLPANSAITITITGTISPTAVNNTVTGSASIAPPVTVTDPNTTNNTAIDSDTVFAPSADLQVAGLTVTPASLIAGNSATYTFTISNPASTPITVSGATPSFVVSPAANATATSWSLTTAGGATAASSSGTGFVNGSLTLPPGSSVVVTQVVALASTATTLTATASVTTPVAITETDPSNNSASLTNAVTPPQADLSVALLAVPSANVQAGSSVTYTLTAKNAAGPDGVGNAQVTLPFSPTVFQSVTWTAAYSNGATGPASGTGNINTTLNLPFAPGVGGQAVFTIVATINPAAPLGFSSVTATVTAPPPATDTVPANNSIVRAIQIIPPSADLGVSVNTVVAGGVVAGTSPSFTVVVTNSGPSLVNGATVSVPLPTGTGSANWTATYSAGSTGPASGVGAIAETPTILVNGSVTYTFTPSIVAGTTGNLTVNATVTPSAGTTDPTPANNGNGVTVPIVPGGDLSTTLTNGTTSLIPGTSTTYTFVVRNTGPDTATDALVTLPLPAALTGVTWTTAAAGGAIVPVSGTGSVNQLVTLPNGGSVTFTVVGFVDPVSTGVVTVIGTITPPSGYLDIAPGNNAPTDTDTLVPTANLSIVKTDGFTSLTAGDGVTYTITVSNVGPSTAPGVRVQDTLSALLLGATWTATVTGGATATLSGSGSIDQLVLLPPASTVVYTLSATVNRRTPDTTLSNSATVTVPAGVTDPVPGDTSSTDTTTVVSVFAPIYAVAAGTGGGPHVRVFNAITGAQRFSFYAFDPRFAGGVRVATADVNGDGQADIITAAGPGGGPHVRVFDGLTLQELYSFYAYAPNFSGGVYVAAGDVNGDGYADIVTGAGESGGAHVRVFSGRDGTLLREFLAFTPTSLGTTGGYTGDAVYASGVRVAVGDTNGDGMAEIIAATGPGRAAQVRIFNGADNATLNTYSPFPATYLGGLTLAAGDYDGDGRADVIVGAGNSATPVVQVFQGGTSNLLTSYLAFSSNYRGGINVAAHDLDGDGRVDVIASAAGQGGPHVTARSGNTREGLLSFYAFDPSFLGGVFVG